MLAAFGWLQLVLSFPIPWCILSTVIAEANDKSTPREAMIGELDRRFRLPLKAYFRRRVSSAAEAEDLTQDVFERILKVLSHEPIENAEALVFRIAVNLLRDRARRNMTHGAEQPLTSENIVDFADALTVDLSPERVVLGERDLADVVAALQELSERTRAIFYLYRLENLKIREIATVYGISASAVEKHVSKALLHLTRHQDER
jgi:RNA polymerase sigma factor (sigma-70 family)